MKQLRKVFYAGGDLIVETAAIRDFPARSGIKVVETGRAPIGGRN